MKADCWCTSYGWIYIAKLTVLGIASGWFRFCIANFKPFERNEKCRLWGTKVIL